MADQVFCKWCGHRVGPLTGIHYDDGDDGANSIDECEFKKLRELRERIAKAVTESDCSACNAFLRSLLSGPT